MLLIQYPDMINLHQCGTSIIHLDMVESGIDEDAIVDVPRATLNTHCFRHGRPVTSHNHI